MCGVNGDTTLFLLRSVINLIERLNILTGAQALVEHEGDGGGQRSLAVVNVTNRTNVYVRFGAHEFCFSHSFPLFYLNE
jgi:hypothetical protein